MPQNDTCISILLNLNLYYLHFYFCQCGYNQTLVMNDDGKCSVQNPLMLGPNPI